MKLGRLNHVGVATPSIEASVATYRELMGATVVREPFDMPTHGVRVCFIDEVIMPHSTRRRVALGLRKLRNKQLENPWKKHDNIPL